MGGCTPEELETLLEDAIVLGDEAAVATLFEAGGVLVARPGSAPVRGRTAVRRAASWLCGRAYVAEPRRMLRTHDLALVTAAGTTTVARRGTDGVWRYAFAVFTGAGPAQPGDPGRDAHQRSAGAQAPRASSG